MVVDAFRSDFCLLKWLPVVGSGGWLLGWFLLLLPYAYAVGGGGGIDVPAGETDDEGDELVV